MPGTEAPRNTVQTTLTFTVSAEAWATLTAGIDPRKEARWQEAEIAERVASIIDYHANDYVRRAAG